MVAWLLTRNWVLNDIVGVLLVFCFLRVVRINSFLVSTILLVLLFGYDIFWVFYSDRLFGSNVMLNVALKFDLPIKLLMPHFSPLPSSQCMLIGLGDLIIPGLVIAFAYRISEKLRTKSYYVIGLLAYFLAIALCEVMLFVFQQAQPALLYISPLLILGLLLTAFFRKEVCLIWKGNLPQVQGPREEHEAINSDVTANEDKKE